MVRMGSRSVAIASSSRWALDGVAGLPSVAPCSAPPGREAPYHGVITMTDLRDHDDRSA